VELFICYYDIKGSKVQRVELGRTEGRNESVGLKVKLGRDELKVESGLSGTKVEPSWFETKVESSRPRHKAELSRVQP